MKSFIKNNLKLIIGFIAGIILASGIAVYASVNANSIDYTNNKKVSDALNELYTTSSTYKKLDVGTTATADDILTGKTAYSSSGQLITGLKDLTPTFGTPTSDSYQGPVIANPSTTISLNKGKYLLVVNGSYANLRDFSQNYSNNDHSGTFSVTCTNNCNLEYISTRNCQACSTDKISNKYVRNLVVQEIYSLDVISNTSTITAGIPSFTSANNYEAILINLSAVPISN